MDLFMAIKDILLRKAFATVLTLVRPLPCMVSHVNLETPRIYVGLVT